MKKPLRRLLGGWAVFLSAFCFYLSSVVIRWSQAEVSITPSYFVVCRISAGIIGNLCHHGLPSSTSASAQLSPVAGKDRMQLCGGVFFLYGRRFDHGGRSQCHAGGTSQSAGVNEADNLTDETWQAGEINHGNDGNFVVKVISLIAGIDHPKVSSILSCPVVVVS